MQCKWCKEASIEAGNAHIFVWAAYWFWYQVRIMQWNLWLKYSADSLLLVGCPRAWPGGRKGGALGPRCLLVYPESREKGTHKRGTTPRDLREPPTPTSDALGNDLKDRIGIINSGINWYPAIYWSVFLETTLAPKTMISKNIFNLYHFYW